MSIYDIHRKRMHSQGNTIGQIHKNQSDEIMEQTWNNDIASRVCYIYDWKHDDQPEKKDHMTYENTTKTRIDAKFIVKSYQSLDKDQVEYYLQFRPSQKVEFVEGDELYYYETDYRKRYGADFPIGMMCDIPDDKGIYRKWLICRSEPANQFPKYLIIPVNYYLMWIENTGLQRIKRKMWCAIRMFSSYTSGTYTDTRFTRPDNQAKLWLEMNPITEKFWYTDEDSKNMRLIVSALTENPVVWRISKIDSANPLGIQQLNLYQDRFNDHTDYVNLETGEMYADYFDSEITPTDPSTPTPTPSTNTAKISASTSTIKVGGSYKNLTVNIYNDSNEDVTTECSDATISWTCSVDDEDWSDKVTWRDGTEFNQMKLKFPNDDFVIGKILTVKCTIVKDDETIESEMIQLELIE